MSSAIHNLVWAGAVSVTQFGTCIAHKNSDANDPKLLRLKSRANTLRDWVLIQRHYAIVNPLAIFYCPHVFDSFCNSLVAWTVALTVIPHVGWRHLMGITLLGGFAGGSHWCYQAKNWPRRLNTRSDVGAASNAAISALSGFSIWVFSMQIPVLGIPLVCITLPYVLLAWFNEYWYSSLISPPAKYDPQVHNGGVPAGFAAGFTYGALFSKFCQNFEQRTATQAQWLLRKATKTVRR